MYYQKKSQYLHVKRQVPHEALLPTFDNEFMTHHDLFQIKIIQNDIKRAIENNFQCET